MPRYAPIIAYNWNSDDTESILWTSETRTDSTLTGGPWAPRWMVYCSGGITSAQFGHIQANSDVRTLDPPYRLDGLVCEEDPPGVVQTHGVHGAEGQVSVITMGRDRQYSRYPHLPSTNSQKLGEKRMSWPLCAFTDLHPSHGEKLGVLVGHIDLPDVEMAPEVRNRLVRRI